MSTWLLVVDVQNGFVSKDTAHVPPRIKELLASGVFDNIVFTRFYNAPGSPYRRILDWHRLSSQHEQQIHSDLLGYADVVLDKGVYSAVTPELLEMLREADAADVFIAGIDTDCCVLTTAVDLFQEGIRPLVLSHYCASNGGADSHTAALTCLGRLIGLRNVVGGQIDADAIEKALEPASPGGDAAVLEKTSDFMVTREDLRRALTGEPATAMARMLEFLEVDFREQLDSDVGVWERYTLREHVFMVIGQYERYFMRDTSGSISSEDMLLVLALHDIGKPAAVAAGDKRRQGEYTRRVAEAFLAHLGFADDHVVRKLIRALSAHDPIGRYLKTGDLEASLRELEDAARTAGMDIEQYLVFVRTYFMVDASSYTADALMPDGRPGHESLDWLFEFDHVEAEMRFAEETARKVDRLTSTTGER